MLKIKKEDMAKAEKVIEDHMLELLRIAGRQKMNAKKRQIVKAGKELALLCLWLKSMGADFEGDERICIGQLFSSYPEELKEILAYYEEVKGADVKGYIQGFNPMLRTSLEGVELNVHFKWKRLELPAKGANDG